MAGIHFDITADNTNFIQQLNGIENGVEHVSKVIKTIGENFDLSSPEAQITALSSTIRQNKESILQLNAQIKQYEAEAEQAFNNGDFAGLKSLTTDIELAKQQISELAIDTQQYQEVLSLAQTASGINFQTQPVETPKLFKNESDYTYVQELQTKIGDLQNQIAQFDGSDEDLNELRKELSGLNAELYAANNAATEAASKLGMDLGGRASEAQAKLYELNSSVKAQEEVLTVLQEKLAWASEALANFEKNGDATEISNARVEYDMLAQSVNNAQQKLMLLKSEQAEAKTEFTQVSAEINQHDSAMVKMLGGYENYQKVISNLPQPIQMAITSINGMTSAAAAFIRTPLGIIIGAIVLALQALKLWFNSSKEGQIAFAEASGVVSGILDQLKEIAIAVGKAVYQAVTNPKKAIKKFGDAIVKNIANRLNSVGKIATSLGAIFKAVFTGHWDDAKAEAKNLLNAFLQLGTGIEDVTDKVENYVEKVATAAKKNAAIKKSEALLKIGDSKKEQQDANRQQKMETARVKMSSKNPAEVRAAIAEYKRLSEEQMKADEKQLNRRIELQKQKMALTTNSIEDENELRSLETQKIRKQTEHQRRMAMLSRRANRADSLDNKASSAARQAIAAQNKENKQNAKIIDLMRKQSEERMRQQQEFEFTEIQNRIDLMEEGDAKVLAQLKLDHQKELTELERQERSAIDAEIARQKALFDAKEEEKASTNKSYVKKNFDYGNGDIGHTVKLLMYFQDEIDDTQKELDSLITSGASQEAINEAANNLGELDDLYQEYAADLGDISQDNIKDILKQYDVFFEQLYDKQDKGNKKTNKKFKNRIKNILMSM